MSRLTPPSSGGASSGRLRRAAGLGAVAAILAGGGAVVALSSASPAAGTTKGTSKARVHRRLAVPPRSIVAKVVKRRVVVYHYPGAKHGFAHFAKRNALGQPRVFLVAQRLQGWERVYLPMRPNGVTGWVRDRAVSLAYDPYRVVVSLGRHRITVFKKGRRILRTKAGVGRSVSKTPKGIYFLVELLEQPDPTGVYGPFAFGTSAFSNTYYHFGAGPGEIGLHGTDYPQGLGTNVSHGCIRIANPAIRRLARLLPLGTPLVIEK